MKRIINIISIVLIVIGICALLTTINQPICIQYWFTKVYNQTFFNSIKIIGIGIVVFIITSKKE